MPLELDQYKMPILQNVNDIPSVIGQETHPNGSLFCKQYNDLIDALKLGLGTGNAPSLILTTEPLYYLIDADNGDDNTAVQGGQDFPYLTIEKVFEDLKLYDIRHDITIELRGLFQSPVFNFESLYVKNAAININLISDYGEYFFGTRGEIEVTNLILTVPTLAKLYVTGVLFRLNNSLFLSNVRNIYFTGCEFLANRSDILNPINDPYSQLQFTMIVILSSNVTFELCTVDRVAESYTSWNFGMTIYSSNVIVKQVEYLNFVINPNLSAFIRSMLSKVAILQLVSTPPQDSILAELASIIMIDDYFSDTIIKTEGSIILTNNTIVNETNMYINAGLYN